MTGWTVSPDKQWLALVLKRELNKAKELYAVGIGGGEITEVIGPLALVENLSRLVWSPNSKQFAYVDDREIDEIYIVDLDGGSQAKVSNSLGNPASTEYGDPRWSPDGLYVIHSVYAPADDPLQKAIAVEVYDVTYQTRATRVIEAALGRSIRDVTWSPDSKRFFYLEDMGSRHRTPAGANLHVSDLDGRIARINHSENSVFYENISWSPDGKLLAYTDLSGEAHVGAPSGAATTKVIDSIDKDKPKYQLRWSPDSKHLAYLLANSYSFTDELHIWSVASQTVKNIREPFGEEKEDRGVGGHSWSPDSSRIAYVANLERPITDLYVTEIDGLRSFKVNTPTSNHISGDQFSWSVSGDKLVYLADGHTEEITELYSITMDGSSTLRISEPLDTLGDKNLDVTSFDWSSDGERLIYVAGSSVYDRSIRKWINDLTMFSTTPTGEAHASVSGTILISDRLRYRALPTNVQE